MLWRKWIRDFPKVHPKRRPDGQVTRLTQRLRKEFRRSPTAQSPRLELKTWLQVDQRYGNLLENRLEKKKHGLSQFYIVYICLYMSICFSSSNSMVFWCIPSWQTHEAFTLRSGALQELWDVKPWPLNLSWFGHFTLVPRVNHNMNSRNDPATPCRDM
jgi:hypothetical protein